MQGEEQLNLGFVYPNRLEKFQLLWGRGQRVCLRAPKVDDPSILLVCDLHDADMSCFRNKCFHSFDMHFRTLCAGTMPRVHAVLHHSEPISLKVLSKILGDPFLFFGGSGQVKEYEEPHDAVFIDTGMPVTVQDTRLGRRSFFCSPARHSTRLLLLSLIARLNGLFLFPIMVSILSTPMRWAFASLVNSSSSVLLIQSMTKRSMKGL